MKAVPDHNPGGRNAVLFIDPRIRGLIQSLGADGPVAGRPRLLPPVALVVSRARERREATRRSLENLGFQVFSAASTREVLEIAGGLASPVDVVAVDVDASDDCVHTLRSSLPKLSAGVSILHIPVSTV